MSLKQQAAELRATVAGMTQTIAFLGESSQMSVTQLQTLEKKLRRVSGVEDTRQVMVQINACVELVRAEMVRVQSESKARIASLQAEIARLSAKAPQLPTAGSNDQVTGLPLRELAEEAITAKILSGRESVAALFVVDRVASINGRFGRLAGDEVLIAAARHIAQRLTGVSLFRWTGPAFVAVLEQTGNLASSEEQIRQAGAMRLQKSIEAANRSAMLMVTCSVQIHKLVLKALPASIFQDMDAFLSTHFNEKAS
jgi:diguanylate cyclase (GGDEF)-like protein